MKRKNHIIFVSVLCLILVSCKTTSTSGVETPLFGEIRGLVLLHDTIDSYSQKNFNFHILSNNSGVKVTLEGTSFSALTDSNGMWIIENVPSGTYTIVFEKNDYAVMKKVGHQFIGNGSDFIGVQDLFFIENLNIDFALSPFADYKEIKNRDSTYYDSTLDSYIHLHIADTIIYPYGSCFIEFLASPWSTFRLPREQQRIGAIIFGRNERISLYDPSTYIGSKIGITQSQYYRDSADLFFTNVMRDQVIAVGFKSNERIYFKVYVGYARAITLSYPDLISGKPIYPAFNSASIVKSIIIP